MDRQLECLPEEDRKGEVVSRPRQIDRQIDRYTYILPEEDCEGEVVLEADDEGDHDGDQH